MPVIQKLLLLSTLSWCASSIAASPEIVNDLQQQVIKAQQNTASIQQEINKISAEESQRERKYRLLLHELSYVSQENTELEQRISRHQQKIASLKEQQISANQINSAIQPLILQMQQALADFIEADLPFYPQERLKSLVQLEHNDGDVALDLTEKYLRLSQLYKQELTYGKSIELYRKNLQIQGQDTQVNIYRLGRLALYAQRLDGKNGWQWSQSEQDWLALNKVENANLLAAVSLQSDLKIPQLVNLTFNDLRLSQAAKATSLSQPSTVLEEK